MNIFGFTPFDLLSYICIGLVSLSFISYLLPLLIVNLLPKQNLKRKYNATWAVVTGSSSGIGKAIATRLAGQGLNVVLVALADKLLDDTHEELQKAFSSQQFVKCGCDLSRPGYMDAIKKQTKGLPISIVINNAGYLKMGFFRQLPADMHLAGVECNAVCSVAISHHFYCRMINEGRKGCITFTSSAAGYFPSPFVVLYGASKAFLSSFAQSLSVEAKEHGIDVMAVHPSYTATNLYATQPKLGILNLFAKFAATPYDVADVIINSVGRGLSWRDTGGYALFTRMLQRFLDVTLIARVITASLKMAAEYKGLSGKPTVVTE
eukprot:TRINITY_DN15128_c0_g1_i1.p1 TRINITY_DN15128_c0_g1~~TRINITY_DN15128_c0_g1_i1.p1  ORF type:complete len:321 (+),score=71.84 TRINITY_DN15128_c0_g1_i1:40-1002(+)